MTTETYRSGLSSLLFPGTQSSFDPVEGALAGVLGSSVAGLIGDPLCSALYPEAAKRKPIDDEDEDEDDDLEDDEDEEEEEEDEDDDFDDDEDDDL